MLGGLGGAATSSKSPRRVDASHVVYAARRHRLRATSEAGVPLSDVDELLQRIGVSSQGGALALDIDTSAIEYAATATPVDMAYAFDGRQPIARNEPFYLVAKRLVDILGSGLGLLLVAPLMLMLAALIKITSRGPVFYRHTRVGIKGSQFTCLKFRTMVQNADKIKAQLEAFNSHGDNRTFKIPNDPRVTFVGRWLRRTSLDELPQLINVLLGEMSLVGPRPALPVELDRYSLDDMRRLEVKPGLTCIWQVSGRSRIAFPEQLEMDIEYIRRQSVLFDLELIARTIPAVVSADGAY
ncbi:MAG: sugar transferase [Planctomycetales bacterium]|nr:sugar transferase [Planctomycetales bacterium]